MSKDWYAKENKLREKWLKPISREKVLALMKFHRIDIFSVPNLIGTDCRKDRKGRKNNV